MERYKQIVMDHLVRPRNLGPLENPDGIGKVSNEECGDGLTVFIKVDGDRLADVGFTTMGCGASIAAASMLTDLAKGKTLAEARELGDGQLAESLGIPPEKVKCADLGGRALRLAIDNYTSRVHGGLGTA